MIRRLYHVVKNDVHLLEFDPSAQWRFHRRMCWVWILTTIPTTAILGLDIAATVGAFSESKAVLFTAVMLGINTYYSQYANFATDFDAVSASYAAMRADQAARQTGGGQ